MEDDYIKEVKKQNQNIHLKWDQMMKENKQCFAQDEVWKTKDIVRLPQDRLTFEKIKLLKEQYLRPDKDTNLIQNVVKNLKFFMKLPKGVIGQILE